MKKLLPRVAAIGIVTGSLVVAGPAQALSCAPASVWTNSWDSGTTSGVLQKYSVDPSTGDLTVVATVPITGPYGDIAIATEDGDVWGTEFDAALGDEALIRINPATGAEEERVPLAPTLTVTDGDTSELNSLSFRADGNVYLGGGWTTNVFTVDPSTGSWTAASPATLPALDPTVDYWSAGDFLTLDSGLVLALANTELAPGVISSYLVVLDPTAATSRIVGTIDLELYGAAQSGRWIFFAGSDGSVYRLETVPLVEDLTRDITPELQVAFDGATSPAWWGIASPQDSGVCPATASTPGPRLPDTGADGVALLSGASILLAGVGVALAVRSRRRSGREA